MKNYFKILLIFILLFISPLQSQWIYQQLPSDIGIVLSVDFINNNNGVSTGWILNNDGEGRALYTNNGGSNWYLSNLPDSARSLVAVQMLNNTTGYSTGAYNIIRNITKSNNLNKVHYVSNKPIFINKLGVTDSVIGTKAFFLKTTNTGLSWFPYGSMPNGSPFVTCMNFVNELTGFISAERTQNTFFAQGIYKTTNGGLNWVLVYSVSDTVTIQGIKFINASTGFAVGYDYFVNITPSIQGITLKTTNSGINWTKQIYPEVNNFTDVSFTNINTGFACGVDNSTDIYHGIVYKTTNSGISWNKLTYQSDTTIFDGIEFYPATGTGIAYGIESTRDSLHPGWFPFEHLVIAKTTDYGLSWQENLIPNTDNFYVGSKMLNASNWYLTGGSLFNAKILHTTNGGQIGIEPISSEIPKYFKLFQNYPNPFNPTTKIRFDISGTSAAQTFLYVYDILGREVTTLVNEKLQPGTYEVDFDGSNYPSGIYFYKITTGSFSTVNKMILLK